MKLAFLLLATVLLAPAQPTAILRDSEVYVRLSDSAETRQLTRDGKNKYNLIVSHSGQRLAFIRETGDRTQPDLVILGIDGKPLNVTRFPNNDTRGIEDMAWITDDRIYAAGSINPSTVEYMVFDVNSGKQSAFYAVDGFNLTFSPDGSHVAYVGFVPHFTAEEDRRPQFCLDDECLFDHKWSGYPGNGIHIEFHEAPSWSADGKAVAITGEHFDTKAQCVIVRRLGSKPLEFIPPGESSGDLAITWKGATLDVDGKHGSWRLEAGATEFNRTR